MAIALDNFRFGTSPSSIGTISHTVTSNTNGIVVAFLSSLQNGTISPTPTFNGTAMSVILRGAKVNTVTLEAYYYLNPPTGVGTIIGTTSASGTPTVFVAASYTGVNQSTPISGSYNGSQNFAAPGTLVDTGYTAGNLFVGALYNSVIPGTLLVGTEIGTAVVTTHEYMLAHIGAGTLTWKVTNSTQPMIGVELNAAASGIGTSLIQSAGTSGIGLTSISSSWTGATTTGNTIVVGVAITNAVTLGTVTSVTDTQGNTYTKAVSQAGTAVKVVDTELWYATKITGGAGSVTVNLPINAVSIYAREYSGVYNTLDKTSSALGSSSAINSGTTATTTKANELLVMCTGDETGGTQTYQAAGNFGDMVGTTTTATGVSMSDAIVSATGAQTGTQTMTVADEWVSVLATFYQTSNATSGFRSLLGVGV